MTPQEAIKILRQHNEWRRYDGPLGEGPEMGQPKEIGEAIDTVCDALEQGNQRANEVLNICTQAVDTFGVESQTDMAIEECAELINALEKHRRGRNSKADVVEEIADVMIMCFQMTYIFGGKQTYAEIEYKASRLKGRIEARKAENSGK